MNAINNQVQGCIGMSIVGFGALHLASSAKRDPFIGISTAIGSVTMLASFYNSHKFKREDGHYNYSNIAMTAFVAISLTAFNIAYWMLPTSPSPGFCDTNQTNWMCKPGQSQTPKFSKATGEV